LNSDTALGSAENPSAVAATEPPGRIAALFARIAKRFPRTEDDIADRYSGCGWGDETERRRLLDDVFNGQRGGFFR
jgi:hypothetical protein